MNKKLLILSLVFVSVMNSYSSAPLGSDDWIETWNSFEISLNVHYPDQPREAWQARFQKMKSEHASIQRWIGCVESGEIIPNDAEFVGALAWALEWHIAQLSDPVYFLDLRRAYSEDDINELKNNMEQSHGVLAVILEPLEDIEELEGQVDGLEIVGLE